MINSMHNTKLEMKHLEDGATDMAIDETVYIAEGAMIVGRNIRIGDGSSVWFNCVIRCDDSETVTIGSKTNIQDLTMVHTGPGHSVSIGDGVTIGHKCLIHGCSIGDNTLIGMGSIIMDGAHIGSNCIIGAGSLITEGKIIPDGTVAFGSPVKVIREADEDMISHNKQSADIYAEEAAKLTEQVYNGRVNGKD